MFSNFVKEVFYRMYEYICKNTFNVKKTNKYVLKI